MKDTPPPEVSEAEWEETWKRIDPSTSTPWLTRGGHPMPAWRRLAYAATFVAGVLVGGAGVQAWQAPPEPPPEPPPIVLDAPSPIQVAAVATPTPVPEEPRGVDFDRLKNVRVEPIRHPGSDRIDFRVTAETPTGVPVVMLYNHTTTN